jgi:hypothetical protein
MARVRYVTEGSLQIGSSLEDLRQYGGPDQVGKSEDVPEDVAALLAEQGIAEAVKGQTKKA